MNERENNAAGLIWVGGSVSSTDAAGKKWGMDWKKKKKKEERALCHTRFFSRRLFFPFFRGVSVVTRNGRVLSRRHCREKLRTSYEEALFLFLF